MIGLPIIETGIDEKSIFVQLSMCSDSFFSINGLILCLHRHVDLVSIPKEERAKCIQTLYIVSGCDYLSFWVGHGKASFLSTFFKYS